MPEETVDDEPVDEAGAPAARGPPRSPVRRPQAHDRDPVRGHGHIDAALSAAGVRRPSGAARGRDAPVAVITNQNLAELAEGGQITIVGAPRRATARRQGPRRQRERRTVNAQRSADIDGCSRGAVREHGGDRRRAPTARHARRRRQLTEEYWRGQALKIRLDWKAAVEEVDELQGEVADLRRRFYQEDDPFYRDNEIKPAWDRALDRLQEAKAAAETQERKLNRFLEEGRRRARCPVGCARASSSSRRPPRPLAGATPPHRRSLGAEGPRGGAERSVTPAG